MSIDDPRAVAISLVTGTLVAALDGDSGPMTTATDAISGATPDEIGQVVLALGEVIGRCIATLRVWGLDPWSVWTETAAEMTGVRAAD